MKVILKRKWNIIFRKQSFLSSAWLGIASIDFKGKKIAFISPKSAVCLYSGKWFSTCLTLGTCLNSIDSDGNKADVLGVDHMLK